MVPVARRFLRSDLLRVGISVGGVAFAALLIVLLVALYRGILDRAGRLAETAPAQLWVAQAGAPDPAHTTSILPASTTERLSTVQGVEAVQPLFARTIQVGAGRESGPFTLVMAIPEGPLQQGTAQSFGISEMPNPDEIILSEVVADEIGAGTGDTVFIGDRTFRVAGVSSLVEGAVRSTAVVNAETARPLLGHPQAFSYALATISPNADRERVAEAVETQLSDTNALTPAEFADVTREELRESFVPVIGAITGVAFVVGLAVIALTIYSSTIERVRDYGVLKAVGASTGQLVSIVMRQSVIVAIVGFVLGAGLAVLAGRLLQEAVPAFATLYRWQDLLFVLGSALVMSAVATAVPVGRLARIDPALVFRA